MIVNIFTDASVNFKIKEKRKIVMEICLKHGLTIRDTDKMFKFIKVKSHTGKKDKISLINQWCDDNAKKYMNKIPNKSK